MTKTPYLRRLLGLGAVLFVILFGLGTRLVFLQVFLHDRYRTIADSNTQSLSVREPRRGDILDANGNPIAVSIPVKRVIANPVLLGKHHVEIGRQLAASGIDRSLHVARSGVDIPAEFKLKNDAR